MINLLRKITPNWLLDLYHLLLAFTGALLYGFPSRSLIVIGITGTNGKSTTVDMLARIFAEYGEKVASLSSIRFQVRDKEWENTLKMTMPGRFAIQKFLRQAARAQCKYVILEVTSEGIAQHRHCFISFDTAVLTNLSPEHIERHGSFQKYQEAKGKLFATVKNMHIINADTERATYFLQFLAKTIWTYGIGARKGNHIQSVNMSTVRNGVSLTVCDTQISLRLLGLFNAYNALCASTIAMAYGVPIKVCKVALEGMRGVPGRMDEVISKPFRAIVDYAFTPVALEQVYQALKPEQGRLICVLGAAGGGRDVWKRPVLGSIAKQYCDSIIITNEDPYEEDPLCIMQDIARATGSNAKIIPDRRQAISDALRQAISGDVVVCTGKGSENSIAQAGGKKIFWNERQVVKEELARIKTQ